MLNQIHANFLKYHIPQNNVHAKYSTFTVINCFDLNFCFIFESFWRIFDMLYSGSMGVFYFPTENSAPNNIQKTYKHVF